jgi:hypothetical protein
MNLNRRDLISGAAAGVALSMIPKVFGATKIVTPKVFEYSDIPEIGTIINFNSSTDLKTRTAKWETPDGRKGIELNEYFPLQTHNLIIPVYPIGNSIDCHLDKHTKEMDKMMLDLLFGGMKIKVSDDLYNVLVASGDDQKIDITDFNQIKESHAYFGRHDNNTIVGINPNKSNTVCCLEDNSDFIAHVDNSIFRRKRFGYYSYKYIGTMNSNPVTVYNYLPGFVIPKTEYDLLCDKMNL